MKKKILFLLFTVAFSSLPAVAQVTLTAKKVTYTRRSPIQDFKKTFTITYPRVKAATPAISRKIENILSYEKVFEFTLKEEMGELQWLEEASYDVNYNANSILSISLQIEGSGAYPSASTRYLVINTATGTRVRPADVFTNTGELLAKLVKIKDGLVAKALVDIKNDPEMKEEDLAALFKDSEEYHKVTLDQFEVDEGGITFYHEYGFPHVAKAMEPDGDFFLTWAELKPYIKTGGLLGQFVR